MILVSAILVLAAIGLLIAGVVVPMPVLVIASIAVSVLSTVFLLIGAFLRRKELFGSAAPAGSGQMAAVPSGVMQTAALSGAPVAVPAGAARSWSAAQVPRDQLVFVVPGRKRYHVDTCRVLEGREREELTREEAREEGFTPCTTCEPDGPRPSDEGEDEDETPGPSTEKASTAAASPEMTPGTAEKAPSSSEAKTSVTSPAAQSDKDTGPSDKDGDTGKRGDSAKTMETPVAGVPIPKVAPEAIEGMAEGSWPGAFKRSASKDGDRSPRDADAELKDTDPKATQPARARPATSAQAKETAEDASKAPDAKAGTPPARKTKAEATSSAPPDQAKGAKESAGSAGSTATVKVITGTRRYHSAECPLIKGADETGIETMTKEKAESSGLTHCSVCRVGAT